MPLVIRNALIALLITGALVATVVYAVKYLNRERVAELSAIEDQIAVDTLSIETQFSLLETAPCGNVGTSTDLSGEIADLDDRLDYAERTLGADDPQVVRLKKQYSLLEIRDYLATRELAAACGTHPTIVLYFYSNGGDCAECDRAGYALSYLRTTYPSIKVYSFDYRLDLGALKTLESINRIAGKLPAFVVNGRLFYGFTDLATLEREFPKGALAPSVEQSAK